MLAPILENESVSEYYIFTDISESAGEEEARDLMNELEIMAGVGFHDNLVNLIGACTYDGKITYAIEIWVLS